MKDLDSHNIQLSKPENTPNKSLEERKQTLDKILNIHNQTIDLFKESHVKPSNTVTVIVLDALFEQEKQALINDTVETITYHFGLPTTDIHKALKTINRIIDKPLESKNES